MKTETKIVVIDALNVQREMAILSQYIELDWKVEASYPSGKEYVLLLSRKQPWWRRFRPLPDQPRKRPAAAKAVYRA